MVRGVAEPTKLRKISCSHLYVCRHDCACQIVCPGSGRSGFSFFRVWNSFRSLDSNDFPSGYSKSLCVCASACTQKTPNLRCFFVKRRLTNTPRRRRLADGQLSSLYAPPSFSSFGAASVLMCCSARPASSSAPLRPIVLPKDRIGRKYSQFAKLSLFWQMHICLSFCPHPLHTQA